MTTLCSDLSTQIDEPLAGSAPTTRHIILITWPKKFLTGKAVYAEGLPDELFAWREERVSSGDVTHIRLISKSHTGSESADIYIYPGSIKYAGVKPDDILNVLKSHYNGNQDHGYEKQNIDHRILIMCTHGKHDQCCAKHSSVLVPKINEAIAGSGLDFDFYESSHIGGHRLAGTCVVLPEGRYYGRVHEQPLDDFLSYINTGRVFFPAYRGNAWMSMINQSAEAAAHKWCYENDVHGDIELHDRFETGEGKVLYSAIVKAEEEIDLKITLVQKTFESPTSCFSIEEPSARDVWTIAGVDKL
jgi:hypothetical protein